MDKNCYLTNEQRRYISNFLLDRQKKLSGKARLFNIARNVEGKLSSRQKAYEKKTLEELSQIHEILHELFEDDFKIPNK